jgi:hypothetical protein
MVARPDVDGMVMERLKKKSRSITVIFSPSLLEKMFVLIQHFYIFTLKIYSNDVRINTFRNTFSNDIETKEVQVTGLAASVIKKRGRPPLTEEVKAAREKDKLESKQAAKRAKLVNKA